MTLFSVDEMIAKLKPYQNYMDSGEKWLGEVPKHWDVRRLGQIGAFSKGSGGSKEDESNGGVPCIRYGDLYTTHRYFIKKSRSFVSPTRAASYTPIKFGDLLFAASGETIEEIGKSAVNLITSNACCGGDVILFRPRRKMEARYLGYAADCWPAVIHKATMGRGFTVVHIYPSQLKHLSLAVPPLPEQATIARFLDYMSSRITRYIGAKKKLIVLLEEYRQVVVSDAVMGRFDVRTGKPYLAYRPSEVAWLEETPAHWEITRIKNMASIINGATPSTNNPSYWGGDILWLTPDDLGSFKDIRVSSSARKITQAGYNSCGASLAPRDSIVLSIRAPIGYIAILDQPGCVNQGCKLLTLGNFINAEYIYFMLLSARGELQSLGVGTTFDELSRARLGNFQITIPPLPEQAAIARFLNNMTEKIQAGINQAQREIDLLHEYRTRLISDVVTGKLDVREAATMLQEVDPDDRLAKDIG